MERITKSSNIDFEVDDIFIYLLGLMDTVLDHRMRNNNRTCEEFLKITDLNVCLSDV